MGKPPAGKTFSIEVIDIVRMPKGRIAEHWGLIDTAAMAEQLGLWSEIKQTTPAPMAPGLK